VDTRLRKLDEGAWDAIILAEASLDRLDLKKNRITVRLDMDWFIPCASQGALAIETRDNSPAAAFVRTALNDFETQGAVAIERQVLARLGGDCTMPFGCLVSPLKAGHADDVSVNKNTLPRSKPLPYTVRAAIYTPQGQHAEILKSLGEVPSSAMEEREWEDWVKTQSDAIVQELKEAGGGGILQQLKIPLPPGWT
jgi:hydroxymethylbilane synthase